MGCNPFLIKIYMKKNIQYLVFIGLTFGLFLSGCKREELAEHYASQIINLKIKGTTLLTEPLEFVKNGVVFAETMSNSAEYEVSAKISIAGPMAEIQLRRKSDKQVIATKTVTNKLFNQELTCYYDGKQVYDALVKIEFKGYSGGNELEFMLDGVLLGSGTGTEFPSLTVVLNKENKRQIQIRKKGDSKILLDYVVLAEVPLQKLVFYYDGTQLLDKIELATPENKANMLVSVSYKSNVAVFSGPADLVFYKGSMYDNVNFYSPTEFRIPLNSDGSFSKNFELPALSLEDIEAKLKYGFKLVKRGTLVDLPYDITNELKPILPLSGFYVNPIEFTAGGAMILVISDSKTVKTTGLPSSRGTLFGVNSTDISAFFKP